MKKDQKEKIAKKMKSWQVKQTEAYKVYVKTSAVGLEFGLAILIGALIGYFADKYFASSPYGLIIGAIIGSVAAAKRLWMFSKSYLEKNDNEQDRSNSDKE